MTSEDRDNIRPEVVEALMAVQLDLDVSAMARIKSFIPPVTQAELAAAQHGIGQVYLDRSQSGESERQLKVAEILGKRQWGHPATDAELWAELSDEDKAALVDRYDVLTEGIRELVDRYRAGGEAS